MYKYKYKVATSNKVLARRYQVDALILTTMCITILSTILFAPLLQSP